MLGQGKEPLEFLKYYNKMETIEKQLIKGGEFIIKETQCDDIFTPEDFTDEQKMMRDAVRDFADKEIWGKKR